MFAQPQAQYLGFVLTEVRVFFIKTFIDNSTSLVFTFLIVTYQLRNIVDTLWKVHSVSDLSHLFHRVCNVSSNWRGVYFSNAAGMCSFPSLVLRCKQESPIVVVLLLFWCLVESFLLRILQVFKNLILLGSSHSFLCTAEPIFLPSGSTHKIMVVLQG